MYFLFGVSQKTLVVEYNTPSPSGSVGDQQSNKAGCPTNSNYQ